jgi:hypothetical protein
MSDKPRRTVVATLFALAALLVVPGPTGFAQPASRENLSWSNELVGLFERVCALLGYDDGERTSDPPPQLLGEEEAPVANQEPSEGQSEISPFIDPDG